MPGAVVLVAALALAGCAAPRDAATSVPASTSTATISGPAGSSATAAPSAGTRFEDAAQCENEELGYEVDYPGDWWANERVAVDDENLTPIPACQYFAREPVELQPNAGIPGGIAVRFHQANDVEAPDGRILLDEETTVDDQPATFQEYEATAEAGFVPEGSHVYRYVIELANGYLVAMTDDIHQDTAAYEETKPILDEMMRTLELDERAD